MNLRLSLLLLLLVFAAPIAQADKLAKYKPPHSFNVEEDFYVIEGAGLIPAGYDGALDVTMWDGSKREDITKLIKEITPNSQSPAIRSMIDGVILSESNTNDLDDYEDIVPGDDLLTLRIFMLMEGGYYKEALELYSVAVDTPHHSHIAKAGILAMLGSGEKSIACLEMKTLGNMNMSDPFWPTFMAYCNYTLSERPSKDAQEILEKTPFVILRSIAFNDSFVFPYTPMDWDALTLLEQNVLIAEKRIEAPAVTPELLDSIPPKDIAVLLKLETFSPENRLALMLRGSSWGLVSREDIAEAYASFDGASSTVGDLPLLYKKLAEEENHEAINATLLEALALHEQYGDDALLPFAEFFAQSKLSGLTPEQMIVILRLLYKADVSISPEIIENYIQNPDEKIGDEAFFTTMQAIPLVLKMPESHEFMKNMQKLSVFHKNTQANDNVIENLDNTLEDVDNAGKVYEKDVDAAAQKGHEDAHTELLKRLGKLSKRNILGETVLLSMKLLSGQSIREADQDLYSGSLDALKGVKLEEFSRKMAIERLIGDTKEEE